MLTGDVWVEEVESMLDNVDGVDGVEGGIVGTLKISDWSNKQIC